MIDDAGVLGGQAVHCLQVLNIAHNEPRLPRVVGLSGRLRAILLLYSNLKGVCLKTHLSFMILLYMPS